jgi:hypothetical protein
MVSASASKHQVEAVATVLRTPVEGECGGGWKPREAVSRP